MQLHRNVYDSLEDEGCARNELGFLDLPGEIRNIVYDAIITDPVAWELKPIEALFLANASRALRQELLPLVINHMLHTKFGAIDVEKLESFVSLVLPRMEIPLAVLEFAIDPNQPRTTNIKFMVHFIHSHPEIDLQLVFLASNTPSNTQSRSQINRVFEILKSKTWRKRLSEFSRIELVTGCPVVEGGPNRSISRMRLRLCFDGWNQEVVSQFGEKHFRNIKNRLKRQMGFTENFSDIPVQTKATWEKEGERRSF